MKVSGASCNTGIRFVGDKYAVNFVFKNNSIKFYLYKKEGEKTNKISEFLNKIPFIRGFIVLFGTNGFLFFIFLLILLYSIYISRVAQPISTNVASDVASNVSSSITIISSFFLIILLLFAWISIFFKILFHPKTTCQYHGAEHKVIYTYEEGKELTLENCRNAPRENDNCGTMLVVLVIFVNILLERFLNCFHFNFLAYFSFLFSFSIAYELFRLNRQTPIIKWLFKFGYWLQKVLFTREPTDSQLTQAIEAFQLLAKAENGQMQENELNALLQARKKANILDKLF